MKTQNLLPQKIRRLCPFWSRDEASRFSPGLRRNRTRPLLSGESGGRAERQESTRLVGSFHSQWWFGLLSVLKSSPRTFEGPPRFLVMSSFMETLIWIGDLAAHICQMFLSCFSDQPVDTALDWPANWPDRWGGVKRRMKDTDGRSGLEECAHCKKKSCR